MKWVKWHKVLLPISIYNILSLFKKKKRDCSNQDLPASSKSYWIPSLSCLQLFLSSSQTHWFMSSTCSKQALSKLFFTIPLLRTVKSRPIVNAVHGRFIICIVLEHYQWLEHYLYHMYCVGALPMTGTVTAFIIFIVLEHYQWLEQWPHISDFLTY